MIKRHSVLILLVGSVFSPLACAPTAPPESADADRGAKHLPAQASRRNCRPSEQFSFSRAVGRRWQTRPALVILSRGGDSRVKLTRDSVDYWNRHFEALGSGFRLGEITLERLSFTLESYMPRISNSVLSRRRGLPNGVTAALKRYCGSIVVVLAENRFISFAKVARRAGLIVVGIKGETHFPFILPNVARNVIAHELGHAIGLRHNADPTKLMCGRPAPCRPTTFASPTPSFFPITDHEKRAILDKYPADWPGT